MDPAVGKAIDEFHSAFEDFKASNDERLKQIEKNGRPDPILAESVDKMSGALSQLESNVHMLKDGLSRQDDLEERLNRIAMGISVPGAPATDELLNARNFAAMCRGVSPEDVPDNAVSIDAYRGYRKALRQYMRRGDAMPADVRNQLEVGREPGGGYWVEPDTSGRISTLLFETSPMRQVAFTQQISTDALEGVIDYDEADSGWVSEQGTRSDTDEPDIGKYRIPAHEQYAQPRATQTLLDDGMIDVESWLARKVADKLARTENTAFITGNGVGKPRGITTYGHGTPSATTWNVIERIPSGAAGAFAASDPGDALVDMVFALKAPYRANARWGMARLTIAEVRKLKDGDGTYLWAPNFADQQGGTLLGHPITEMDDMPAIAANALSIAFADFQTAYTIVDRTGVRVLRDPYTSKPYIRFYTTKRTGGDVTNFEAIKLMRMATAAE